MLRFKMNEDKPNLVLQPCFKVPKNTFGHNSDNLGPFPIIFCHNTQWIRRKFWPFIKFCALLVEILKNFEKTIEFWWKLLIFKMHVLGTLQVQNLFGIKNQFFFGFKRLYRPLSVLLLHILDFGNLSSRTLIFGFMLWEWHKRSRFS